MDEGRRHVPEFTSTRLSREEQSMMDKQIDFWERLRNLRKSAKDKKIAGVCGGFGEHTPIPAWLWRAFFLILLFAWGSGLVA